jgi:hypothetical protein
MLVATTVERMRHSLNTRTKTFPSPRRYLMLTRTLVLLNCRGSTREHGVIDSIT